MGDRPPDAACGHRRLAPRRRARGLAHGALHPRPAPAPTRATADVPASTRGAARHGPDRGAGADRPVQRDGRRAAATREREAELLANLRHDLRTPVTVIGGYAAALIDGTASGPDAERAATAIAEEASRLEALVDELGAVEQYAGGAASLRPASLEVATVLAAARERFAARAAAGGVELALGSGARPDAGLSFAGDPVAVDRLIGNLVSNALGAIAPGGHVWLDARPARTTEGRPAVALLVTDDGPGFPPGATERVFERFFRADQPAPDRAPAWGWPSSASSRKRMGAPRTPRMSRRRAPG